MTTRIAFHGVKSIMVTRVMESAGNFRMIEVETDKGIVEIGFHGETDVLDNLDRSEDYKDYDRC